MNRRTFIASVPLVAAVAAAPAPASITTPKGTPFDDERRAYEDAYRRDQSFAQLQARFYGHATGSA